MERSLTNTLVFLSVAVTIATQFNPELLSFAANAGKFYGYSIGQIASELLFYQFLHGGFFHLLSNAFFLVYFGPGLERLMGTKKYLLFFLGNTVFVYGGLYVFTRYPTIGISGFCMAILAYTACLLVEKRSPEARGAFFMLGLNILIGITGPVSLVGHTMGGLFGAIVYGITRKLR